MTLSRTLAIALWLLLFLTVVAEDVFVFGWTKTTAYHSSSFLGTTVLMFGWFLADAKERDFVPSIWLKIAVVAVGVIALPYYKFRNFGARAGFVFIGIVLLAFVTTLAATLLVEYLAFGRVNW
jgi:hypothetical protein